MTEVPEHLLRRSKERRAALGLDGGAGGDAAPPAEPAGGVPPAAEVTPAAAASAAPVPAAAPPPAVAAPPPPLAPYVVAALTRTKIPKWAVPMLAVLPIWALIYAGTMTAGEPGITDPVLAEGEELYSAQCAACHGAEGEGGTGRALDGGAVLLTFPDPQQHLDWVRNGSPAAGTPYGDPNRPGGQQVSQTDGFGAMPAFGTTLSDEEIIAVVRYERELIGGETESALAGGPAPEGGNPTTTAAGGAGGASPPTTAGVTGGNVGGTGGGPAVSTTVPGRPAAGGGPAGTATTLVPNPPGTTVTGSG